MNLPSEFSQRMQRMLGEESDAFFEGFHRERSSGLRANLLKTSVDHFQRIQPFSLRAVPWCDSGFYYDGIEEGKRGLRPGKHPLHEAGLYYIQEPSAMAVAQTVEKLLKRSSRPLKVLDLCAAPGGKSSQLAGLMKGRGFLVSNEIHPARAKILSQNMERMGLVNGIVVSHCPEELNPRFSRYFDVIVVDAPCSGEGMFRKDEDTVEQWSPDNVRMCARRQKDILTEAEKMLAPGGTLIYSTCTFAPAENEEAVLWMIRNFPGWRTLPLREEFPMFDSGRPEWIREKFGCSGETDLTGDEEQQIRNTLRLWPHRIAGEGHFIAKLRSPEEDGETVETSKPAAKKKKKGASSAGRISRPPGEWKSFSDEVLGGETALQRICGETFRWLLFGDQLYAAPENCPSLSGLTVLRPGLHLGTIKKGRLEPSHALAMALMPELIHTLSLGGRCAELHQGQREDGEALAARYLRGEALSSAEWEMPPAEGWCLLTYDGFPLGWGKASGGTVKNHYPKGLRWV